jgi:hypothetical protein
MSIASQVTTPTVVSTGAGRIGICVYDNPNQTNNNQATAYVLFPDGTWGQYARANLTVVVGALTGESAFAYAPVGGSPVDGIGP